MTKSTTRMVFVSLVFFAFALGMLFQVQTQLQPVMGDEDATGHWDHDGDNVFLESQKNSVGIGTAEPARTLDVLGTGRFSDRLDLDGGLLWIHNPTGSNRVHIGQGVTSNQYSYMYLSGDTTYNDYGLRLLRGNTGADTWSELTHRGTGDLKIRTIESAPVQFVTANAERMRISENGDVGIGTVNPAEKLEVAGNLKLGDSPNITANSGDICIGNCPTP